MVSAINGATPEITYSLDSYLAREQRKSPMCQYGRWVAHAESGQMVGMGEYGQWWEQYRPGRYYINLFVIPEWRGTGLRELLYDTVIEGLEAFSPQSALASAYETRPEETDFWQARGFIETMRSGGAWLDLTTFDFNRYTESEQHFADAGFTICSILDLAADPDRDEKLCALHNTVMQDVPPRGERNRLDSTTFVRQRLEPSDVLHDTYLIALSPEGEYVGMTQLRKATDGNPQALNTGLTGVHPDWRRHGIALALKLRGLREAKARGCTIVRTWNASQNEPILALNRQLGYIRTPWQIHYRKTWEGRAE